MKSPDAFDPADPTWLAHRYDPADDRVMYRHLPRAMHRDGPFLTDELVGDRPKTILARSEAVSAARSNAAPVNFVFHSAFCASTMLVRAFDTPGVSMGLSEPVLLNDVVGIHRRGERTGADLARLLDEAVTLLARRWSAGEHVVIKPSNILCGLQRPLLALRPDAHAILLFAPLRTFLISVARKGLWCRLWVRELLQGLIRDGLIDFGFAPADYFRLSDLQVAAVGWLAQHRQFAALATQFPARIRTIESERLLSNPDGALRAAAALFGVSDIDAVAMNPALVRHSKSGVAFSASDRADEHAAALAAHGDEIDKVHAWALTLAETAGVAMTLPLPLLD
ncbi:hypothetical protein [Sphingomonas radiodurans]|uniref:hypothetical protein n=1 Tax=Sphingomonas radiodurans TaxID=2890321 RepID=UPI001E4AB16E|nr:hypothetical protein [Sphingomonas radiodurans]WBH15400.1 hypothetical protein LLW23_11160 [Sphingomonas radiodurans]